MESDITKKMRVCEIFKNIQGESTYAGSICSFVRLAGCNLSCSYCDTQYAAHEATEIDVAAIIDTIRNHQTSLVEITGGEPLLQKDTPELCRLFIDSGYTVLVETNGSIDISGLPEKCIRIVDIKCPGSGAGNSFLESNYEHLTSRDECKLVISDRNDFDWALKLVRRKNLYNRCTIIFSPFTESVPPEHLAEWIVQENAPVRLGLQLHKLIWGNRRGV